MISKTAPTFAALLLVVVATATPAYADIIVSQDLGASAYSASGQYLNYAPSLAFDGITTAASAWNSGGYATQWIEVNLGQQYEISSMQFTTAEIPNGLTVHQIWVSNSAIQNNLAGATLAATISEDTVDDELLTLNFSSDFDVQYVQVRTTSSPSWVAWREVQVYAVPEPSSFLLTGGAFVLLLRWQRRRFLKRSADVAVA